jgi:hypothetical protein
MQSGWKSTREAIWNEHVANTTNIHAGYLPEFTRLTDPRSYERKRTEAG